METRWKKEGPALVGPTLGPDGHLRLEAPASEDKQGKHSIKYIKW